MKQIVFEQSEIHSSLERGQLTPMVEGRSRSWPMVERAHAGVIFAASGFVTASGIVQEATGMASTRVESQTLIAAQRI